MRLQLVRVPRPARYLVAWLISAWTFFAAPAWAGGRTGALVSVYVDDDDLTVISPHLSADQDVIDELSVGLAYDVDIISAATVDVRTAASPRGYEEVRHGLSVGGTWRPEVETSVGARYLPSWEADFQSHAVGSDVSHEWRNRRLITKASVLARFNQVGRAGEPKSRWHYLGTGILGLEQGIVVDRFTVATLSYELSMSRGFTSNPYRFVPVYWDGGRSVSVPELTPGDRNRHAGRVGARRALTHALFLDTGYRLYGDDWGVVSHTGDAELQYAFWHDLLVAGVAARGYYQSAASFYESRYGASTGSVPQFRTADKQLAESWSLLADARLEVNVSPVGPFETLSAAAKVGVYDQHFIDFAPLDGRRALTMSLGIAGEY